jgi:hypothetical protein
VAASAIQIIDHTGTVRLVATDLDAGVHTIQVTTDPPDSAITFVQPNGFVAKIGTVLAAGVHTVCVTPAA